MAQPRRILPGRTYLVTRRCIDRRYLLKPSPIVDQILLYALAVAAALYGIDVHGFVFLSNHHHLVLTDRLGLLPRFTHWFHSIVARFLNAHGLLRTIRVVLGAGQRQRRASPRRG